MIDFHVAADKLAGFQTADEIAEYLQHEGIKAYQQAGDSCAISVYMNNLTGQKVFTGGQTMFLNPPSMRDGCIDLSESEDHHPLSSPMKQFITNFDSGLYPDLVLGVLVAYLDEL